MRFNYLKNFKLSANLLIVSYLLVAAVFVRIFALNDYSITNDEAWHLVVASQKNLFEVIRYNFINEIHPPLSPIIWHFMLKLGDNYLWLRSTSLLASILAIPAAYKFGKLWIGREAGIAMGLICAFGMSPIVLSGAIRAYSMLILAILLIGIFAFNYLNQGKRKDLILYLLCCFVAIELHHSAAFVILTFGIILLSESFLKKGRKEFLIILLSHIFFAVLLLGYYFVLTKFYDFKGNNSYFSSAQTLKESLYNYLSNFYNIFILFLPDNSATSEKIAGVILLITISITPLFLILSRKWKLLCVIFLPLFAVSFSDYFGYYPFSITARNNLFLTLSILVSYGYLAQILVNFVVNFIQRENNLSQLNLKDLLKQKKLSLAIIIFRPFRILFYNFLSTKNSQHIVTFFKVLISLLIISLITFTIFKQDFFRKTWIGCTEFLITKQERHLLLDKLQSMNNDNNVLITINSNIWKFQFENHNSSVEVITKNLAKFTGDNFTIYFSSFPEREKGANSSIKTYRPFFTDLFNYLESQNNFSKIKSIIFFDSGLSTDYLTFVSRPNSSEEIKEILQKQPINRSDYKSWQENYNLALTIKNEKSSNIFHLKDKTSICGREILILSLTPEFIKKEILTTNN